jgi:multisubunit Na+/H+ antiporter MnhB subunit
MRRTAIAFTIAILAGAFLVVALGLSFGEPPVSDLDDYYIENGQILTAANNIVTAVVFDLRGFDTLGEATVLFTGVLTVGVLFRKLAKGEEFEEYENE